MGDLYTLNPDSIVFYGTSWCGDCRRARQVFSETETGFLDIDIEQDEKAAEFIKKINNGFKSVPTIIFPDGSILTEPSRSALVEKLEFAKPTA